MEKNPLLDSNGSSQEFTAKSMKRMVEAFCSGTDDYLREIYDAHKISKEEFIYFIKAFWPRSYYTISKNISEIRQLVDTNDCDTYLRFDPTPELRANDIGYTLIHSSDYREDTSCYSIALLKCILEIKGNIIDNNTVFYFTKGLKLITLEDRSRVIKTIVLFYVVFSDGSKGYYDIADDPTHKLSLTAVEKGIISNFEDDFINQDNAN